MVRCQNCGNEVMESTRFCPECGEPIRNLNLVYLNDCKTDLPSSSLENENKNAGVDEMNKEREGRKDEAFHEESIVLKGDAEISESPISGNEVHSKNRIGIGIKFTVGVTIITIIMCIFTKNEYFYNVFLPSLKSENQRYKEMYSEAVNVVEKLATAENLAHYNISEYDKDYVKYVCSAAFELDCVNNRKLYHDVYLANVPIVWENGDGTYSGESIPIIVYYYDPKKYGSAGNMGYHYHAEYLFNYSEEDVNELNEILDFYDE